MAHSSSSVGAPRRLRRLVRPGVTFIAALATAVAATACSGAGAPASSGAGGQTAKKVTTLTYWSWTKGSADAVAAFNQAHPDIQVEFEEIPGGGAGGYSKISDAMKAGNGPDVFNSEYVALPSFVASGVVADITDKLSDNDKAAYDKQALNLTTLDGKVWGVPYDIGVQTMFYRKDLFGKYGLTVPKTWAEFEQTAEKVNKAHPGTYLANLTVDDAPTLEAMVQQAGGHWFSTEGSSWKLDFQDDATKQVASYWQRLVDKKLLSPAPSYSTGFNADVAKGKILTILLASWQGAYNVSSFPDLKGKWAVAPLPSLDGQPASGTLGGSAYAISKKSKNVGAAVEFAKWMTTNRAAVKARVGDGKSSAYVANSSGREAVKASFSSDYYAGQDLYSVFEQSASGLKPTTFGPTMLSMNQALASQLKNLGKGTTLTDAIASAQGEAKSEMTSLGLSVKE